MQRHKTEVLIIGAGISGLSAATRLTENGIFPCIVEKRSQIGGLATTIRTPGFDFDLGGHRWYSEEQEVDRFFHQIMGNELVRVPRFSRIAFRYRQFFQYPIRFSDVVRLLGFRFAVQATLSLIRQKTNRKQSHPDPRNAKEAYVRNFGESIYATFFREYTERLWGIPCEDLDGQWVGQRSDNLTFWKIVKGFFFKVKGFEAIDDFAYPRRGYGRFCDRMAERVAEQGVDIKRQWELVSWERIGSGFLAKFK
ncbi:MAG: NAD(P)-binding protein, partial [Okeania sp. SIO1H5]|uniref:NAD(P)-binding protein n=1 Tax=Okeania sp. SIO1H5 TaxID=2607777 RepID=UPI0013BC5F97